MRKRTGDWRDLLSAYSLALETNKVFVGFCAALLTALVMFGASLAYAWCGANGLLGPLKEVSAPLAQLGTLGGERPLPWLLLAGRGLTALRDFLPLLDPFYGNLCHFALSILTYAALFCVWGYAGGVVSRLAVLEYAKDDLPTLGEARQTAGGRFASYVFALWWPLVIILVCTLMNTLGGVIASIPILGRFLLVFPGYPLLLISTGAIVFVVIVSVLALPMVVPAVSASGRGGLENWIAACSYVIYGLRRFVCYALLAGVVGLIAAVLAWAVVEMLIFFIFRTVSFGFLGSPWMDYNVVDGARVLVPGTAGGWNGFFSFVMWILLLLLRGIPAGYAFSYFFTAGTVVFFLMRKSVDNVEIEEIYEEEEELQGEDLGAFPAQEAPAPEEGGEAGEGPESEQEEDEPAEEPEAPEESEGGEGAT